LFYFDKIFVLGRYFVYFFGPDFEYTWSDVHSLIPYSGLDEFIRHAQTSVQNVCLFNCIYFLKFSFFFLKATSKSEQEALANRFELKVAASKRPDW